MRARDARHVLLLRAFETPTTAPWSDADAQWANREARQVEGSRVTQERFIVRRAALGSKWLCKRDPAISTALSATRLAWWLGPLIVVLAFLVGAGINAIGIDRRLNILAPPMLGVLAWNLAVYLLMIAALVHRRRVGGAPVDPHGPLMSLLARVPQNVARVAHPSLLRFMADWAVHGRQLHLRRAAAILHGAAASLAIGAIAALYLRGLAFEYRAGWESTFLSPRAVLGVVRTLLGPAAWVSNLPLPRLDQMAAMHFTEGGGVGAATFIHLWAITLWMVVIVPRLVLTASAIGVERKLSNAFPLSLDDAYFQRFARMLRGKALPLRVLPYGITLEPAATAALRAACEMAAGQRVELDIAPRIEPGSEEEAARLQPGSSAGLLVLFASTATPERETHGLLLHGLCATRPGRVAVAVDESAFSARFTGAGAGERRDQRRAAWREMAAEQGLTAVFIELSAPASRSADQALTASLSAINP